MEYCKICGMPASVGYIIPSNHYDNEGYEMAILTNGIRLTVYGDISFTVYKTTDGFCFLDSGECLEILERTGYDLCDNIDIDEPLTTIKLTDGKCIYCITNEQQLKLFQL